MKVTSYGLFWREAEIEWTPGRGNRSEFRLLGRVGENRGKIKVADFRQQRGIYILYDEYGPRYVGLARDQGLGKRLKDHLTDHLGGKWQRFSWFGFYALGLPENDGVQLPLQSKEEITDDTRTTIGELEALLIRTIGPRDNRSWMKIGEAEQWVQIDWNDTEKYLKRVQTS